MLLVMHMKREMNFLGIYGELGFPLHTHLGYEILYFFEGDGVVRSDMGDLPISAGKIIIIPPHIVHGTDSENGFKAIAIRGDFGNYFKFDAPLILSDNEEREGDALIRMIFRNQYGSNDYLKTLIDAFVHFLLQNASAEDALTGAVRKIANALTEHFFDSALSPAALLNESGYAEDYIRAHFKKIIGKTPNEFLANLRINHAKYLIEVYKNALTLSEVSEHCGFTDYVYFSKKFKELVGSSPKDFKKLIEG